MNATLVTECTAIQPDTTLNTYPFGQSLRYVRSSYTRCVCVCIVFLIAACLISYLGCRPSRNDYPEKALVLSCAIKIMCMAHYIIIYVAKKCQISWHFTRPLYLWLCYSSMHMGGLYCG